jgi:chlorobactene glucosyltransferase
MGEIAVIEIFFWLVVFVWLAASIPTLYSLARQRFLLPTNDPRLLSKDAPLVSVLIPARNEAGRVLRESLASVLAQDYGRFEVIAVDDRSTDATQAILHSAAIRDDRLRVVAGTALPANWLGKPWAMQQALDRARGEWILATDADIIFERSALRTAMTHLLANDYDALTLIPHFESRSFWERIFIPTWAWRMLMLIVLGGINKPRSPQAKGMGGFFLIRRAALESVGGYRALRDEVVEDMSLAARLKRAGARLRVEYAPELIRTRMYTGFSELWESCSRNWFALLNYSLASTLLLLIGTLAVAILPSLVAAGCAVLMLTGQTEDLWPLFIPALAAWAMEVLLLALINRRNGIASVYALITPLGFALQCALLLNSAVKIKTGKGVTWKGRKIYEDARMSPPGNSLLAQSEKE